MTKEQIQKRINKIDEEIGMLEEERESLRLKLETVEAQENTKALLDEVKGVNPDNSMVVQLCETTRTTPIMDEFYNSDMKYLVFERLFLVEQNWTWVSLVVAKKRRRILMIDGGLTMTDLKKSSGRIINENSLRYIKETNRLYALEKELISAALSINDKKKKISFDNPIRLGGQTFSNQTGYGSSYEGSYQVSQGTLYGETTSFCIIGIIVS